MTSESPQWMTGGHAATNEAANWIGHQKIVIKWVEDISSGPFLWCTLVNLSNLLTLCIIFLVYDNVTGLDIFFSREEEIKWAPLYCQYATSDWVYWGEKKKQDKTTTLYFPSRSWELSARHDKEIQWQLFWSCSLSCYEGLVAYQDTISFLSQYLSMCPPVDNK